MIVPYMETENRYKEFVRHIPNSECQFHYIESDKSVCLPQDKSIANRLLFVLGGKVKISCTNWLQDEIVDEREFMLIPKEYSWRGELGGNCSLFILHFKRVNHVWNSKKIGNLLAAYPPAAKKEFASLKIKPLLQTFLDLLTIYIRKQNIEKSFFTWKDEELLSLLYAIYTPKELSRLFFPVLRCEANFKSFVMANYLKAENASGLAELAGCSLVTLNRKFKKYFNDSAYQWMMHNRIIKIRERLKSSNMPLGEIAKEFGFHSSTELNRFCLRQLGISARKMRME